MTWRIVTITSRAKLDLQLGYMVVRGERTTKIHLSEISILMIETTEVSLTAALLAELVDRKIKVIFCDKKRQPTAELVPYYGAHDTSSKLRQQIAWSDIVKGEVGTAILQRKIKMQAELLKRLDLDTYIMLEEYAAGIKYRDETNREGHAAKVYFNSIFGLKFTRAEDTFENAALNYAYTVLLSACTREVAANGYLTQLGLIHDNMFNQFNLGSDIMEPLRPFVDAHIVQMQRLEQLRDFETETKHRVLSFIKQEVILENKKVILDHAIKIYVKSIFDALNQNDISLIKWCAFPEEGR